VRATRPSRGSHGGRLPPAERHHACRSRPHRRRLAPPEGRQGPLARSLEAYAEYHRRWIETWRGRPSCGARPVAGDDALLERFMDLVDSAIFAAPFGDAEVRSIRRLKARWRGSGSRLRGPQLPLKLGRGSLSDIEWLVQLLQLTHGVRGTGTLAGLGRLAPSASRLGGGDGSLRGVPVPLRDEKPLAPRRQLRRRRR